MEKVASIPIYAAFVYLSRGQHRGLDSECDTVQDLIEDLKKGSAQAAVSAAKALSKHPKLRGFKGVVVPAPRSTSGNASLKLFASTLVNMGVGSRVETPVVRVDPVESSRLRRRRGLPGVPYDDHLKSMGLQDHGVLPDEPVLILDDIVTTGTTIQAVAAKLKQAGHRGLIIGAAAGYYEPDGNEHVRCPVHYQTITSRVVTRFLRA